MLGLRNTLEIHTKNFLIYFSYFLYTIMVIVDEISEMDQLKQ